VGNLRGNSCCRGYSFWKGPRWVKFEFLTYQRVGLLRGRKMGNLFMHASIPSTHFSSLSFWISVIFPFFFVYSIFFSFFLSLCFLFAIVPPSFTVHDYSLLYCLPWQDLLFLPFNHFWLVISVLPRLTIGPPGASHHHYTMLVALCLIPKQKWFCFVSYLP